MSGWVISALAESGSVSEDAVEIHQSLSALPDILIVIELQCPRLHQSVDVHPHTAGSIGQHTYSKWGTKVKLFLTYIYLF